MKDATQENFNGKVDNLASAPAAAAAASSPPKPSAFMGRERYLSLMQDLTVFRLDSHFARALTEFFTSENSFREDMWFLKKTLQIIEGRYQSKKNIEFSDDFKAFSYFVKKYASLSRDPFDSPFYIEYVNYLESVRQGDYLHFQKAKNEGPAMLFKYLTDKDPVKYKKYQNTHHDVKDQVTGYVEYLTSINDPLIPRIPPRPLNGIKLIHDLVNDQTWESIYSDMEFCACYQPICVNLFTKLLQEDDTFKDVVSAKNEEDKDAIGTLNKFNHKGFESFSIMPVQRLPRYKLLADALVHNFHDIFRVPLNRLLLANEILTMDSERIAALRARYPAQLGQTLYNQIQTDRELTSLICAKLRGKKEVVDTDLNDPKVFIEILEHYPQLANLVMQNSREFRNEKAMITLIRDLRARHPEELGDALDKKIQVNEELKSSICTQLTIDVKAFDLNHPDVFKAVLEHLNNSDLTKIVERDPILLGAYYLFNQASSCKQECTAILSDISRKFAGAASTLNIRREMLPLIKKVETELRDVHVEKSPLASHELLTQLNHIQNIPQLLHFVRTVREQQEKLRDKYDLLLRGDTIKLSKSDISNNVHRLRQLEIFIFMNGFKTDFESMCKSTENDESYGDKTRKVMILFNKLISPAYFVLPNFDKDFDSNYKTFIRLVNELKESSSEDKQSEKLFRFLERFTNEAALITNPSPTASPARSPANQRAVTREDDSDSSGDKRKSKP